MEKRLSGTHGVDWLAVVKALERSEPGWVKIVEYDTINVANVMRYRATKRYGHLIEIKREGRTLYAQTLALTLF